MNKTDKTLDEEQNIEITKSRSENGEIISSTEIKWIIRVLWAFVHQQLDNLDELDKFLERLNLPRLSHQNYRRISLMIDWSRNLQ